MKLALVGATGLVGQVMLEVLAERNFPVSNLIPVASARSKGKSIEFKSQSIPVYTLEEAVTAAPDIALFSAGASVSKDWAPKFARTEEQSVIDNSSAWRMDPNIKLVVPEVNAKELTENDKIIANPNCSTIQMVVALKPLHDAYQINRLVISTYQSFTGTGVKAVNQYQAERDGREIEEQAYPYPIFQNCLPHCDVFFDNGYTKEELKLVNETKKILNDQNLKITATAVRVPVDGGHSESVNVEFYQDFTVEDVRQRLASMEGIIVQDDIANNEYPMPLFAKNRDEVFVGRIRRDNSIEKALNLWIVSDNLRKGAATNAVQIAEYLIKHELVSTNEHVNV